ncbi:MAG: hypothetical protein R8G66_09470 [Cytophagales bacterium]|nr:hypothetical protein [Cytophagales bacterium]
MELNDLFPQLDNDPVLLKTLGEIDQKVIIEKSLDKAFEDDKAGFSIGVSASAGADLRLFNDPTDDDNEKLTQKLNFDSQLGEHAFLNYNLHGSIAAKAGAEAKFIKIGVEAEKEVLLRYYSKHERDTALGMAIAQDTTRFKFIYSSAESLIKLQNSEAVAMTCNGKISISSEVQISDVYTAALSKFSKLLNLSGALKVEIGSSASLSFNSEIEDAFEIVIQRVAASDANDTVKGLKVGIHKSKSSSYQASAALKVGVSFDENSQGQLKQVFNGLLNGVENGLNEKLDKILGTGGDPSEEDKGVLNRAATLFDIDPNVEADKLKQQIAKKRATIEEEVNKVIQAKLEFGLSFTYSRVEEEETLFSALFNDAMFSKYIKDIRGLKVDALLEAGKQDGVELTSYEKIQKLDIKRGNKIGLSVLGLTLSKEVEKNYSIDKHEILKGDQIMARVSEYEMGKTVSVKAGKGGQTNSLLFGAGMPDYVEKGSVLKNSLFDYDFGLIWNYIDNNKTKPQELKSILDFAQCWEIIGSEDFKETYSELEDSLVKGEKRISYAMHLKIDRGDFNGMVSKVAELSDDMWAGILAEAVPYADIKGRETMKDRKYLYKQFWGVYLRGNNNVVDEKSVARMISQSVGEQGFDDLARYESDEDGSSFYDRYTLVNLIRTNAVGRQIGNFQDAIKMLHAGWESSYTEVLEDKKFRKDLIEFKIQDEFNMRVLGRMVCQLAAANQIEIENGLEIKAGEKTILVKR